MATGGFEWDEQKNNQNHEKHGVRFEVAQYAFAGTNRIIAEDKSHSGREKRYYCFGKVESGIMTVRFTYRKMLFVYLALVTGEKGERYMKRKIKYTDEPLGNLRIIKDFIPKPEDLVFKEKNVKITITLSKASVDFFKKEAKKHHTQYQKMIRRLLDFYATRYRKPKRDQIHP